MVSGAFKNKTRTATTEPKIAGGSEEYVQTASDLLYSIVPPKAMTPSK